MEQNMAIDVVVNKGKHLTVHCTSSSEQNMAIDVVVNKGKHLTVHCTSSSDCMPLTKARSLDFLRVGSV